MLQSQKKQMQPNRVARTVLAQQVIGRPLLSLDSTRETQKVIFVACFFFLFACTVFDFIAFRQ